MPRGIFMSKTRHIKEHAGYLEAHDPHMWWIFDANVTSPRTCPVCLALDGTHYRGDDLDSAFPYHIHLRVNAIRPMVHPNCRCMLRWAGRTEQILNAPYGLKKKKSEQPEVELTPKQRLQVNKFISFARETYADKRKRLHRFRLRNR